MIEHFFPEKDKKKALFFKDLKTKIARDFLLIFLWVSLVLGSHSANIIWTYFVIDYFMIYLPVFIRGESLYYLISFLPIFALSSLWFFKYKKYTSHLKFKPIKKWYNDPIFSSQIAINQIIDTLNKYMQEYKQSIINFERRPLISFSPKIIFLILVCISLYIVLGSNKNYLNTKLMPLNFLIPLAIFFLFYFNDTKENQKIKSKETELKNNILVHRNKLSALLDQFQNELPSSPFSDDQEPYFSHLDGFVFKFKDGIYRGLSKKESKQHLLCIAPTGMGKTQAVILPNLLKVNDESIIVNDESGELIQIVSEEKNRKGSFLSGHQVLQLTVSDLTKSITWNPLEGIKNYDDAARISNSIIYSTNNKNENSSFWNEQAALLLTVIFYFLCELEKKTKTRQLRFGAVKKLLSEDRDSLKEKLSLLENEKILQDYTIGYGGAEDRVASSILNTVTTAIKIYSKDNITKITATSSFSISSFRKQKVALFLTTPLSERNEYRAYFTLFLNECFSYLSQNEAGSEVTFFLDEFGSSFCAMKSFSNYISTIRKKKMSLCLVVQSIDQLKKYYPNSYSTILSNCLTKIIFSASEKRDCEYFSSILGSRFIPCVQKNVSEGSHQNTSTSFEKRNLSESDSKGFSYSSSSRKMELVAANEIRTMPKNKAIVVSGNQKPAILHLKPYFELLKQKL